MMTAGGGLRIVRGVGLAGLTAALLTGPAFSREISQAAGSWTEAPELTGEFALPDPVPSMTPGDRGVPGLVVPAGLGASPPPATLEIALFGSSKPKPKPKPKPVRDECIDCEDCEDPDEDPDFCEDCQECLD